MQNLKEFGAKLAEVIQEQLSEDCKEVQVKINTVIKNNNQELVSLVILMPEENISPNFYIEDVYSKYTNGASIEELAELVIQKYVELKKDIPQVDVDNFNDLNWVKEHLGCRLVSAELNNLRDVPHRLVAEGNLAVVYYIVMQNGDGSASCKIDNRLMKTVGFQSEEEMYEIAMKNQRNSYTIHNMLDVMTNMMRETMSDFAEDEDELEEIIEDFRSEMFDTRGMMYVVSNKTKQYGASCLLDESFMDSVSERFQDFYILPSSVHECIIYPISNSDKSELSYLYDLVKTVNKDSVLPTEVLSDKVYTYNRETHEILCA